MTEGTIGERSTRRDAPLVCVTGGQHHVRQFLREALSEFDFTIYECIEPGELNDALDAQPPDLLVLGMTAGGIAAGDVLRVLAAKDFECKALPFAQRDSAVLAPLQDLAEQIGIALLPPLLMPSARNACARASRSCCPSRLQALWWTWPKRCGPIETAAGRHGVRPQYARRPRAPRRAYP